ncbi:MAG: helicase-related protein [Chthoniobacterales bacterium]
MKLEDIKVGDRISGIEAGETVLVKSHDLIGEGCAEITFQTASGASNSRLLFREDEAKLKSETSKRPLSFTADPADFRLASEAQRIKLGYLFDPYVAVNTSNVDPLPHQITAVYEAMLGRQPLRFLLADDPGAGKTIMTGLLIKELVIRGDIAKCLIVAPGGLVEQWQDELDQKFSLPFDILTNDGLESSRSGNWFQEHDFCIARLDKLSRNEEVQEKLKAVDWDLVIVDEAHKMSATYFGSELKQTKRFKLGKLLSENTRQLLLLTATPHNGKEQDFQLFLSLIDGDRFEGKMRDAAHTQDASDLMRRMVKENLVTMDGKPLFPKRHAKTLPFTLSDKEADLYEAVTRYVREEFNRAEKLDDTRKGTVGFALTILQRRLASSPEAIYQSLRRRRERLEKRLREEKLLKRGAETRLTTHPALPNLDDEDIDNIEDSPEFELEAAEEQVVDLATTALTIQELELEIVTLRKLEQQASAVLQSGTDAKWVKLSEALDGIVRDQDTGKRRKLVIFTEHRDSLRYLERRLKAFYHSEEAIVTIHGQTPRDQRRAIQEAFTNDPNILVFLATDAAGEGINLQRAHLMVNYDLPWNPNRLEQRFGRIHRIGQREECYLWNLIAEETREADVFLSLLRKLEQECEALNGAVFDVLGELFKEKSLKELLIEAVRRADDPAAKEYLNQTIETEFSHDRIQALIDERSLGNEALTDSRVRSLCDQMERANVRRLQPHHVGGFFEAAFAKYGGRLQPREKNRFQIKNVPLEIRRRDRIVGRGAPILKAYERVTFHKDQVRLDGFPPAALIAPGHPLLDSLLDLVQETHRDLLRQGTVLIDPSNRTDCPRLLLYILSDVTDGRPVRRAGSEKRRLSRRLQFVEITEAGEIHHAGAAPYLDYEAPRPEEADAVSKFLDAEWLATELEVKARAYAIGQLVPEHLKEVRTRREHFLHKTRDQVYSRLTREIAHWDNRAIELELKERAGKSPGKLNSSLAARRRDDLTERLQLRLHEIEQEKQINALPPIIVCGALIIPEILLRAQPIEPEKNAFVRETETPYGIIQDTKTSELLGMAAVMKHESALGNDPKDISSENRGYDIESRCGKTGDLRFIEVKARHPSAQFVSLTRNELICALNNPDQWILAYVSVDNGIADTPIYKTNAFHDGIPFEASAFKVEIASILP